MRVGQNDVIAKVNAKVVGHAEEMVGRTDVVRRRSRVPARMIVRQDDLPCIELHGGLEDLSCTE